MTAKHDTTTTDPSALEPAVGFDVFTVDGLPVGAVSEISGGFMRIDAHMRPDFWLRFDDAVSVEGHAVTLAYPRDAIAQHKLSEPALSADDFAPAGAEPVLLDEEEQLRQRELMERELEEQRGRMAERIVAEAGLAQTPEEERAPSRAGMCVRCFAALAAVAVAFLVVRRWRRRRRHEPAEGPPIP